MYVRYASFLVYYLIAISFYYRIDIVIGLILTTMRLILVCKHCFSRVEYRKVYDGATDK